MAAAAAGVRREGYGEGCGGENAEALGSPTAGTAPPGAAGAATRRRGGPRQRAGGPSAQRWSRGKRHGPRRRGGWTHHHGSRVPAQGGAVRRHDADLWRSDRVRPPTPPHGRPPENRRRDDRPRRDRPRRDHGRRVRACDARKKRTRRHSHRRRRPGKSEDHPSSGDATRARGITRWASRRGPGAQGRESSRSATPSSAGSKEAPFRPRDGVRSPAAQGGPAKQLCTPRAAELPRWREPRRTPGPDPRLS